MEQMEITQKTKNKTPWWRWLILVVLLVIIGGTIVYVKKSGLTLSDIKAIFKNEPVSTSTAEVSIPQNTTSGNASTNTATTTTTPSTEQTTTIPTSWKTFNLSLTKSTIKYPSDMTIKKFADDSLPYPTQNIGYSIDQTNKADSYRSIQEYNTIEWLKGPNPDEGYVLDASKRADLLDAMKEIYTARAITNDAKTSLSKLGVEFLTYTASDRVYVGYVESIDGKARGLAMINTHGQDVGLESIYTVSLYNQEKNSVLSINYTLSGSELDTLRARYGDYTSSNLGQIDREVHTAFANLIANTSRKDLSFGSQMDTVDLMAKSWSY